MSEEIDDHAQRFVGPRRIPGGGDGARAGDCPADPFADPRHLRPRPLPPRSRPPLRRRRAEPAPPAPDAFSANPANPTYFNPAISVIGNFLGVAGNNPVENLPAASLRESEVALPGDRRSLRPRRLLRLLRRTRASSVEEGYITFTALPWDLLAKVGQVRRQFGKINTLHLHVLPWPDEPLPIVNLLGGEEGWIGDGVSVAKVCPAAGRHLLGGRRCRSSAATSRASSTAPRRGDLAYERPVPRLPRPRRDHNLELGVCYGGGPNGVDGRHDARRCENFAPGSAGSRCRPARTARSSCAASLPQPPRADRAPTQTAHGWFVSGDYQLAKRWFAGARYERSDHATNAALHDRGVAATLTFWPERVLAAPRASCRRRTLRRTAIDRQRGSSSRSSSRSAPTAPIPFEDAHETLLLRPRSSSSLLARRAGVRHGQASSPPSRTSPPSPRRSAATASRPSRSPRATRTRTSWTPSRPSS